MEITIWLIATNTAFFTLIWLVQLVIYPGLLHYNEVELARWHPKYTRRVSLITAPLLFTQLILYTISVVQRPTFYAIAGFGLVVAAGLTTFLIAMPLHRQIDQRNETIKSRKKLVRINWLRTAAWTGSFLLSILEYEK